MWTLLWRLQILRQGFLPRGRNFSVHAIQDSAICHPLRPSWLGFFLREKQTQVLQSSLFIISFFSARIFFLTPSPSPQRKKKISYSQERKKKKIGIKGARLLVDLLYLPGVSYLVFKIVFNKKGKNINIKCLWIDMYACRHCPWIWDWNSLRVFHGFFFLNRYFQKHNVSACHFCI